MSSLFANIWRPLSAPSTSTFTPSSLIGSVRFRGQLAPKRVKYRKAHKGRVPVRTGGSTKGTTLAYGDFGLRLLEGTRLSAKQLQTSEDAIKKAIKPVKGAQAYLRIFPDVPVCIKGNETRMGKGKGTFEYWMARVPAGKMVFEVGGGGLRQEIAQAALRLAAHKMPVKTEFVSKESQEARVNSVTVPTNLLDQLPEGTPTSEATAKVSTETETAMERGEGQTSKVEA